MKHYKYKEYISHIVPVLGYGVACGSLTGALIFFFKLAASYLEKLSRAIYPWARSSPIRILLLFAALAAFALIMAFIHKLVPASKGGGIPRSEGILRGVLPFKWLATLIATAVGSFISFFCGLPLGSEGPAVLMGTSVGSMCGNIGGKYSAWNRYVMTGGAGAGFAVATGAPLSAMLFALEEIHKRFTPMLILSVSTSVLSATFVNYHLSNIFGVSPKLFDLGQLPAFELSHAGYLLLLGIMVAAAVGVFNVLISFFSTITKRVEKHFPRWAMIVAMFLITGVAGLFFSEGIYSGHHDIETVATTFLPIGYLVLLYAVRFFMMLLVTGSGATGGIFVPTLALGAVASSVFGQALVAIGMPSELFTTTVFLGMCAFMGGSLRAPLTATLLFVEFTGSFTGLFYVAIVIFTVNFIIEILNQKPFYDKVLDGMEEEHNHGRKPRIAYFEMKVAKGAFVVGKSVRDIMWPSSSVVTEIRRGDGKKDLDHDGEKLLFPDDTVIIRCKFFDEEEIKKCLSELVGSEVFLKSEN